MITEKELFDIGFRRYGDEEDDPFYKAVLKGDVFGIFSLSGLLNNDGIFEFFMIKNRKFKKIEEIKQIFEVNRFNVNWEIAQEYGSDTPLKELKPTKQCRNGY